MAERHFKEPKQPEPKKPRPRRATTPEGREQQLVALAVDVAEEMMRNGNAPAQIVTHYLKIGSTREKIELELKREEIEVAKMRRETMAAAARIESVYAEALSAMREYQGAPTDNHQDEYYDEN